MRGVSNTKATPPGVWGRRWVHGVSDGFVLAFGGLFEQGELLQEEDVAAVGGVYTLDREARGGLYLQKQDGLVYLLWRSPSETELFFLSENGQKMTAEAAQADERETGEAKLLLAFDPETQTGSSMEYLDELFTMY